MRIGPQVKAEIVTRVWAKRGRRLQVLGLVVGLGILATLWTIRGYIAGVKAFGYPGVFFLSFLGSVSMVLPVPGLISLCGISLVLNPLLLGLLAGVGETIGEISGYAIGYGGGSVVERSRLFLRFRGWMERRGVVVIFIASVIPNPIFDLVGIAAGAIQYPMFKFLATVWAGKTLKGIIVGYGCYYGGSRLPWIN